MGGTAGSPAFVRRSRCFFGRDDGPEESREERCGRCGLVFILVFASLLAYSRVLAFSGNEHDEPKSIVRLHALVELEDESVSSWRESGW